MEIETFAPSFATIGAALLIVDGVILTWAALIGLTIGYGTDLSYRFELAGISVHWLVMIAAGVMLTIHSRRISTSASVGNRQSAANDGYER